MPKQKGTHRLLGTTGDMTYSKTKDGYIAKEKLHINSDRFKNSEGYARVRENIAEFGRAGKAGKLLRIAFQAAIKVTADSRMSSRLTTEFLRIIKTDPVSDRGQRAVLLGEIDTMPGFEFNAGLSFAQTFHPPFTTSVNRQTGQVTIAVPAFQVRDGFSIPEGATHARLIAGVALLDFDKGVHFSNLQYSADMVLGEESVAALNLTAQVPAASTLPLFTVLGIQYFISTNAKLYPLNKAFNAMSLVSIDMPA